MNKIKLFDKSQKLAMIVHLQETMEVCDFLIEKLGYTPEGSSVNELIEECKELIKEFDYVKTK